MALDWSSISRLQHVVKNYKLSHRQRGRALTRAKLPKAGWNLSRKPHPMPQQFLDEQPHSLWGMTMNMQSVNWLSVLISDQLQVNRLSRLGRKNATQVGVRYGWSKENRSTQGPPILYRSKRYDDIGMSPLRPDVLLRLWLPPLEIG